MSKTDSDINGAMLASGIALMAIAALCLIFLYTEMNGVRWIGIILLFIIGLGLTVAGSPDPREGD